MRDWKVIAEVYAEPGSEHFDNYACAAVAFHARCESAARALHLAERELASEGWTVGLVVGTEPLKDDDEVRERLEQGMYFCDLHRVRRQIIDRAPTCRRINADLAATYSQFTARAREAAFVPRSDGQVGYQLLTIKDQPMLPIWVDVDVARGWQEISSGRVERWNQEKLVRVIADCVSDDALVALGLTPSTLVTFHPSALLAHLEGIQNL